MVLDQSFRAIVRIDLEARDRYETRSKKMPSGELSESDDT